MKWRAANKKGKVEEAKKKVQKQKKERQIKAIVDLSVEEINKIQESFKDIFLLFQFHHLLFLLIQTKFYSTQNK